MARKESSTTPRKLRKFDFSDRLASSTLAMPKLRTIAISFFSLTFFNLPALADREAGRDVFFSAGCIACHSIACNRNGPKLGGVIGRRARSVSDYTEYSEAMKNSKIIWTEKTLNAYLANPAAVVPRNSMISWGFNLEDEKQRRDLIDFLKEPDNSLDLRF